MNFNRLTNVSLAGWTGPPEIRASERKMSSYRKSSTCIYREEVVFLWCKHAKGSKERYLLAPNPPFFFLFFLFLQTSLWYHLHGCLGAKDREPVYRSSRWTCARRQCHIRSSFRCATHVFECGWRDVKILTIELIFWATRCSLLFFQDSSKHWTGKRHSSTKNNNR